jgi:hypothetical protein
MATLIDPVALDAVISQRLRGRVRQHTAGQRRQVIAIDGESPGARTGGRVFLFAAVDHATGAVIEQESIGVKTNAIPYFAPLLDLISDLLGVVITADALHRKRNTPSRQRCALLSHSEAQSEIAPGADRFSKQTVRLTRDRHDHRTRKKTREHVFAIS